MFFLLLFNFALKKTNEIYARNNTVKYNLAELTGISSSRTSYHLSMKINDEGNIGIDYWKTKELNYLYKHKEEMSRVIVHLYTVEGLFGSFISTDVDMEFPEDWNLN